MSILKIENLDYYYNDGDNKRYILKNISYEFQLGKMYAILGRSGSGKTTLLSLIGALDEPKTGKIFYNNVNINDIGLNNYRRNNVGIIFQSYNLIPYMTALENIKVAMSITVNKISCDNNAAYKLLNRVGIDFNKANRTINKLSGGEQQRVAIARALSTNVNIILADEPTGNLDGNTENQIIEIFKDLADNEGKCVIVVTHSQEIANHADEVLILSEGKLFKSK